MTTAVRPQMAVCPGCVAAPNGAVDDAPTEARLALSLPTIHCQACISTVERGLNAQPGVRSARV
ncbi:MAG: heavy metal-associated domain-containing protein, partial [Pseudomonadota bacterium]|nr:heavy metal-associated domain-containing protein [Pseudomonadota bacterium]